MNETLEHHGILGMKWGVRRYQNKDGTWTKEGKEHRAEGTSQASPEPTANEGSGASSKTADQTVQDISKKLLTEREMMNTSSQRSINAAKTGLNCIKAARPWDGDDFDPESKGDQEWFLIEDQTYGLPQIADLANQGYDEKEINKIISDGLEAYENSKYAEGFNGDKGTDVSGLWYLTMSGYGDGWNLYNISDYIRECANYAKDEAKHSDDSSEDILSHHGILGMKWGIRRYQNADGSLTAAGRKRYGVDENDGQRSSSGQSSGDSSNTITRTPAKSASEMTDQELNQALNRLRMEQQYNELTGAKSSNQYQNQQNFSTPPSNTGNLSNAELQAYITRLDMEKRYAQLTAPPPKEVSAGKKFINDVVGPAINQVAKAFIVASLSKALGLSGDGGNNSNNNNNGGGKNKNNDGGQQKNYDKRFSETNSRIDKLANAVNNLANKTKQDANIVPAKSKNDRNSDDGADNNAMTPASNKSTSNTPHRDSIFAIARNTVRNAQDRWRANEPSREQKRQESREQREKRNASWSAFLTGLERQTGGGINPVTKSYETKAQSYFKSYLSDMSKKQYGKGVSIRYLGGTNYDPPALNKRESNSYSTYDSGSEDYSYYNNPWTYRVNRT